MWLFGGYGNGNSNAKGNLNDLWKYNPTTNQWAWFRGSYLINQLGVYGTKGVANADNIPGARQLSVSWTDSAGNFWLFGGYGYAATNVAGSLNDLWKYNPTTNQWTWVSGSNTINQLGVYGTKGVLSADNIPGGREGAVSWIDSSGNVWLFSGNGYGNSNSRGNLNDLWKYNPITNQWAWFRGSYLINQLGIYGTKGVATADTIPGARQLATGWTDKLNNLWLFSGNGYAATNNYAYLNDLWKYNPTTNEWTWVSGSNTTAQNGVYGSRTVATASNMPGSRNRPISWVESSGSALVFGGHGYANTGGEGFLNDLWKYNSPLN